MIIIYFLIFAVRVSHQREKIREIVYNTYSHPTADKIFLEAKKSIPKISLGTVYRNLKQLEISGEIKTEANDVCLLLPESKGDFLTNLCTPVSVLNHP